MNPDQIKQPDQAAPSPKPAPIEEDDDFNEPLGERQAGANDGIVCEGGCE